MLLARPFIRFLSSPSSVRFVTRELSSRAGRGRRPVRPVGSRTPAVSEASPPVPLKEEDAWVEVKDSAS